MTPPIDPAAINLRIRALVDLHGSIPAVAKLSGIAQSTLEPVLAGKVLPSLMTLVCLCKGLSVSADWLLFGAVPE